jgi:heptosyltransferase-1/heptosyltransferase-2
MESKENILLIRLKSIGDIIFTLPAVHVARENFPDAKFHFLVSREFAPLLRGFPGIDYIIPFDRAVFHSGNVRDISASTFRLLRDLRQTNFSRVIDFQGYGETEFFSWWSGAPERWGNVYTKSRGWTYTQISLRDGKIHPAEWNLSLLRRCGLKIGAVRNEFVLPADALAKARKFFVANNLDETKTTLYIQPFTSNTKKNWPVKNFMKLAWHWHCRGVQILFGGSLSERDALEPAASAGFPISAGAPLLVSAGVMKLSTLIVGADTGLLHLANAMGKRIVMLMQSNAPGTPHPFQHADWTVTPPDGKIVAEIESDAVIETCARAFAELGVEKNHEK